MHTTTNSRTPAQSRRTWEPRIGWAHLALCGAIVVFSCAVFSGCKSAPTEQQSSSPQAPDDPNGTNEAFTTFSQQITSSVHDLSVSPGETLTIPVTVKNTGNQRIVSAGRFPVTFSYKWFDGGKMLPIEGERTLLPRPLNPGDEVSFAAKVVAPPAGRDLTLKLTLVQEAVAWFMTSGAAPLEIRVKMK
jgi:hypothetical protein